MRILPIAALFASACTDKGSDSSEGSGGPTAVDGDGDGFSSDEDCDDASDAIHPNAEETCNGIDDDCDTEVDEDAVDAQTFFADGDGDGFGTDESTTACAAPTGYTSAAGDCDDTAPAIHPGADEICNGLDDDCDDDTDEDAIDAATWYADADGDTFGAGAPTTACTEPAGSVANADDCDDGANDVYPGAPEICGDGVINDCDATSADCALTWPASLSDADARLIGDSANAYTGQSVSLTGDVDGDGLDDLLVGAPYDSAGDTEGAAYLVLGSVSGDVALGSDAAATIRGVDSYGLLGQSVAIARDTNGDSFDDVLVGAPHSFSDTNGGTANLFLGPVSGALDLSTSDASIDAQYVGDALGTSIAGPGDVNDDGIADVLVGAPYQYNEGTAGRVYVFFGPVSGSKAAGTDEDASWYAGSYSDVGAAVSRAGDFDGDGIDDLAMGAPGLAGVSTAPGGVFVAYGSATLSGIGNPAASDVAIIGTSDGQRFGSSVACAGDTDGDGLDDLIVGAPYENIGASNEGAAYLVPGGVSGTVDLTVSTTRIMGELSDQEVGWSVSGAGDVDGDGLDDLLVGARAEEGAAESTVYLLLGGVSGGVLASDTTAAVTGETLHDRAGTSVSGGGDVDGDGVPDVLVGAPSASVGAAYPGIAYVILDRPGY